MDSDSWTRLSTSNSSSRRGSYQSRSETFHLVDEFEGDEEPRQEFLCPFCAEDFDIVGLCCHIDEEHTLEAKNGICPVCAKRVGMDLVSHMTMQHGSLLKISFFFYRIHFISLYFLTTIDTRDLDYVQRKRRLRRGGTHTHTNTNSTLSILKKEFRVGNLHSLFGLQSSSSSSEPEQWLSSFISNTPSLLDVEPPPPPPPTAQPHAATSAKSMAENPHKDLSRRSKQQRAPLSDKDQEEKARRSEFVQGLLFSTFLDDGL
ncbi:unnamed protein product [Lactuca virosa]|uniref:Drought induced 19 protein type zinc-binding domain-containing protein n=1 Tax=Lactuca virosa TaxID=75947 RepID=A0AAU9MRH5_9ASTR|nr:unnamed protein product [Lactuca virosa]